MSQQSTVIRLLDILLEPLNYYNQITSPVFLNYITGGLPSIALDRASVWHPISDPDSMPVQSPQ